MPQAGVSVSPGRTHRGDEEPETADGRRVAERRSPAPRPVRAVPARLASMAEVTAELDFTPRPRSRSRRTSGPGPSASSNAPRSVAAVAPTTQEHRARPVRPFDSEYASQTAEPPAVVPGAGVSGRRTITIQGRPAERYSSTAQRRRPARRPHEREGFRPDRAAMWAVFLGFILVLVAATSSHAATLTHRAPGAHRQVLTHHVVSRQAHVRAVQLRVR